MANPILSIVMPVYNREKYITASVKSILSQTFTNFEFIIVNDGSTDKTVEIIKSFNDKRILLVENEQNRGIVYSRNRGLALAKGEYIGMFDSDDIAYPEKFEKQIQFLKNNTDVGMVGSWVKHIDENGIIQQTKWKLKAKPEFIPAIMLFRNYFVQATVVIRKTALPQNGYSKGFDIVEDSKMWFDVSLKNKVANIQEYLLNYRVHTGGISNVGSEKHKENSKKLFKYIFNHLEINATDNELDLHYLIKNQDKIKSIIELKAIEQWLLKIVRQNEKVKMYDPVILKKVIFNRWIKSCYKAKSLHFKMLVLLLKSKATRFLIS